VDRRDLQALSKARLIEAKALLKLGLNDGAYYLAGYAVECAIKACIAKGSQRHEFPDKQRANASWSHNLGELIRVAGLHTHLKQTTQDPNFRKNWRIAQEWSEESRYKKHVAGSAAALVDAIGDRRHGVIAWIKQHW
jgi:HEPN domain-containing protein